MSNINFYPLLAMERLIFQGSNHRKTITTMKLTIPRKLKYNYSHLIEWTVLLVFHRDTQI